MSGEPDAGWTLGAEERHRTEERQTATSAEWHVYPQGGQYEHLAGERHDHPAGERSEHPQNPPVGYGGEARSEPRRNAPAASRGAASPEDGNGLYRTRRPALAVLLAAIAVMLEVPAIRVVVDGATGAVSPAGVIAGTLLVLGLPLFAAGLYGLANGGAVLGDSGRFWLRPPTGYLAVGLALLLTAGIAAP